MLHPFEYSTYTIELNKSQLWTQVNTFERWIIGGLIPSELAKHNHAQYKKALQFANKHNFGLNDTLEVKIWHAEKL